MEHTISSVSSQAQSQSQSVFIQHPVFGSGEHDGGHRLVARHSHWILSEPASHPQEHDYIISADVVCPGLVDLHVHVGPGISPFALTPEIVAQSGARVACSQGDAGWRNFDQWVRSTTDGAVRSVIALNVAPMGEHGGGGGLEEVDAHTADKIVALCTDHPDSIRMIGVNLSRRALGRASAREILNVALRCRDKTGLPLLIGLGEEEVISLGAQLDQLTAGDVVTYCFRSHPWCLFPPHGVDAALERALSRGVLLDVGHGTSSFDPEVAARAIGHGFVPHTISSDLQVATASAGTFIGLVDVANSLIDCGLSLEDAVKGMTRHPAAVLGLKDGTGSELVGGRAELTVFDFQDGHMTATPLSF